MKIPTCKSAFLLILLFPLILSGAQNAPSLPNAPFHSHWQGKCVAFLGDSITDKRHVGTTRNYWQDLGEWLGLDVHVYGINGHQWRDILGQAQKLKDTLGDKVDAILIFAGTNDYNGGVPLGHWWETSEEVTAYSDGPYRMLQRHPSLDETTFRGRINRTMAYLKSNFPNQQIILLTPIHRGFATFGPKNIQPPESFPNRLGIHVEEYVRAIREAGDIWSVPVIDLYAESGLFPTDPAYHKYFANPTRDQLHPNQNGHKRLAKTILYRLLSLPADFKE